MKKEFNKEVIKKLKPFWEKHLELEAIYHKNLDKLEKEMSKLTKKEFKIPTEFFFVEGECVGIGALNYEDRKKFPLFTGVDLR